MSRIMFFLACALGFNLLGANFIVEINDLNEIIVGLGGAVTFLRNITSEAGK